MKTVYHKTCSRCQRTLEDKNFWKDNRTTDGLCYACKDCYRKFERNKLILILENHLASCNHQCVTCGRRVDTDEINTRDASKDGFVVECKKCYRTRISNVSIYVKKYSQTLNNSVILKYGGCCAICGEKELSFLCIDHINGGGTKDKKNRTKAAIYVDLRDNDRFSQYRVLCHNCNQSISIMKRREAADNNTCVSKDAKRSRAKYRSFRETVINHYGGVCKCCGETRPECLSIDHIDGGGKAHVRAIGGPNRLCEWIIKNNFPNNFRLLCHNCNFAEGQKGGCPHRITKNA